MWPQTLEMSKEECRSCLRSLELSSYSQVISALRAQGVLTENKVKLMEDLQKVFHIPSERHRAEARRVANDEKLCTIAEILTGQNSSQIWAREGRRAFPMLSRVPPQTALSIIANKIAAQASGENLKLPYPADTSAAVIAENEEHFNMRDKFEWNLERHCPIVKFDPFKMPDIPVAPKKSMKRNIVDNFNGSNKRRATKDVSPVKTQQQRQKQYPHITANSDESIITRVNSKYSNINKLHQTSPKSLKQTRQQQVHKQKLTAKKPTPGKREGPQVKSGRRPRNQPQQLTDNISEEPVQNAQITVNQSAAQPNVGIPQIIDIPEELKDHSTYDMPQIASSKKDITKNLTKLHIPAVTMPSSSVLTQQNVQVQGSILSPVIANKNEKLVISTPVQKYIVEDRLPQTHMPAQQTQVQVSTPQVLSIPQNILSTSNSEVQSAKLKAVNTLLPSVPKISGRKLSPSTIITSTATGIASNILGTVNAGNIVTSVVNQPQIISVMDGVATSSTTSSISTHPPTPTHTPPAIIQIQSSGNSTTSELSSTQPTQGKVLTKNILPLTVLGNSGGSSNTLKNGANVISATGAGSSAKIIKQLPNLLLSARSNRVGGSTITISNFRKPPNILKSSITSINSTVIGTPAKVTQTFNTNAFSPTPKIISNIKLPSVAISTTTAVSSVSQQQQHTILQQPLKNITATGIRANVQISPNGKFVIQPANVDQTKSKLPSSIPQKLVANTVIGSELTGTSPMSPNRSIKIIQSPMSTVSNLTGTIQLSQQQQSQLKANTISSGNRNNVMILPSSTIRPTYSLPKKTISGNLSNIFIKGQPQVEIPKSHVVVIGSSNMLQNHQSKDTSIKATFVDRKKNLTASRIQTQTSQMITEDTPVDIINMPTIIGDSSGDISSSNVNSIVPVVSSNFMHSLPSSSCPQQPQPETAQQSVWGIDWEMELDQAAKAQPIRSSASTRERQTEHLKESEPIILDENVIIEEQECDVEKLSNTAVMNENVIVLDNDDRPRILEIRDVTPHKNYIEEDETIEVVDDEQLISRKNDSISHADVQSDEYDGEAAFDETIDTDTDFAGNSSVEYIDEDQDSEVQNKSSDLNSEVASCGMSDVETSSAILGQEDFHTNPETLANRSKNTVNEKSSDIASSSSLNERDGKSSLSDYFVT